MYALEPVVTPSEQESQDSLLVSAAKPKLTRTQTDLHCRDKYLFRRRSAFTDHLQKDAIVETTSNVGVEADAVTTDSVLSVPAPATRPFSHAGSVSSSLAAIRGIFIKAAYTAAASTGPASRPSSATDAAHQLPWLQQPRNGTAFLLCPDLPVRRSYPFHPHRTRPRTSSRCLRATPPVQRLWNSLPPSLAPARQEARYRQQSAAAHLPPTVSTTLLKDTGSSPAFYLEVKSWCLATSVLCDGACNAGSFRPSIRSTGSTHGSRSLTDHAGLGSSASVAKVDDASFGGYPGDSGDDGGERMPLQAALSVPLVAQAVAFARSCCVATFQDRSRIPTTLVVTPLLALH